MKQLTNLFFAAFAITMILTVGLACKSLSSLKSDGNTTNSTNTAKSVDTTKIDNTADTNKSENSTTKTTDKPKTEKADFTVTSEDLDKEFTKKGAKEEDLEKYASKNIAVTGRVSTIVLEKKGTTQPWVTLYAPGILHGVNCYFDDENVEQMKLLKQDKAAKVQGFQDTFIVPEVSPMLKHCVVLEAN